MQISIAMATFNGATYLREELESFRQQGRAPDELVVCDDGSTDETLDILEVFRESAPFDVILIKNDKNLGYTKNFEKALSNCSGDLIFLADQDDIWFSFKIGVVERIFLDNPDKLLIIHDGELVDEKLVPYGATKRGQIVAGYASDDSFITGALTAVRREFLEYALPIPEGIVGHDGWLHNIARILDQRLVIDRCLQSIRRHSSNTTAWVASSLKPIGKLDVVKSQFATAPSNSYQDRLLYNRSLSERLVVMEALVDSKTAADRLKKEYDRLVAERGALLRRDALIHRGFFGRKTQALTMFGRGDYVHFNGLKSFMRDLFR